VLERVADLPADPGRGDDLDALRALCAACWAQDGGGERAIVAADDGSAAAVLERLGLDRTAAG
jgi:hypothetical protein